MDGEELKEQQDQNVNPSNFSEAGKAFFNAMNSGGDPSPEAGESEPTPPVENPTGGEVIPTTEPEPQITDPSNQSDILDNSAALEAVKESILSEIRALKGEDTTGKEGQEPDGKKTETQDEPSLSNDEFMEKFSEDPVKAIMELANTIADKKVQDEMMALTEKVKPLLDKQEELAFEQKVKSVLDELAGKEEFSDAEKYFPQMAEIIKAKGLPQDDINTFINTYNEVALKDAKANKGKSLDEYLADESELAKLLDNPKIKDSVIQNYLQGIAEGKAQPQVISSGGSATAPVTTPTQFKSIAEAGKAFKQSLT